MSETQRQEFRNRITKGQIVYFAEANNIEGKLTPNSILVVKKATVTDAEEGRRYPGVVIWNDVMKDPKGVGICVTMSPRKLFTTKEIETHISSKDEYKGKSIEKVISDPASSKKLAYQLSLVALERMGDDFKRKPNDPEY